MLSENPNELIQLFEEMGMMTRPEIIKLYELFFSSAIQKSSKFAFIGPGTGDEVFAMVGLCQKNGISDPEICIVDLPDAPHIRLMGLLPFDTLKADYLVDGDRIFSFLRDKGVNTIIMRNTPTAENHIPIIISFMKYAIDVGGHGLITIMKEDHKPDLEKSLLELGMQKYDKPADISVTERYIYVF